MDNSLMTVNIALDYYDDLFSEFDISTFKNRAISLDFKENLESRLSGIYNSDLKIIFSLPKKNRKRKSEIMIETRLREYFVLKHHHYSEEINNKKIKGFRFIFMGIIFITLTFFFETFFIDLLPLFLANIIMIFGWFGVWTGIENIINIPHETYQKKKMYASLSNSKIVFMDEEEVEELNKKSK